MTQNKTESRSFEKWYQDGIGSPEELALARHNALFTWQASRAALCAEVVAALKEQIIPPDGCTDWNDATRRAITIMERLANGN